MIIPFTNTAATRMVNLEEMALMLSPNVTVDLIEMRQQGRWELHGSEIRVYFKCNVHRSWSVRTTVLDTVIASWLGKLEWGPTSKKGPRTGSMPSHQEEEGGQGGCDRSGEIRRC
jgi:hypothetical protein